MADSPEPAPADDVTGLLHRWASGDEQALDRVTELLYAELRSLAASHLRRERPTHTLQPTALIHEAYLRLHVAAPAAFANRRQFLGLTAKVMRQVLVDHARRVRSDKRGGGAPVLQLTGQEAARATSLDDLLALDAALTTLASLSERQARVIELRYFGGLGLDDIAGILGVSAPTVSRDQRMAEAWLNERLQGGRDDA